MACQVSGWERKVKTFSWQPLPDLGSDSCVSIRACRSCLRSTLWHLLVALNQWTMQAMSRVKTFPRQLLLGLGADSCVSVRACRSWIQSTPWHLLVTSGHLMSLLDMDAVGMCNCRSRQWSILGLSYQSWPLMLTNVCMYVEVSCPGRTYASYVVRD